MDLWSPYSKLAALPNYGMMPMVLNTGSRHTASLVHVSDRAVDLKASTGATYVYSESKRYLLCKDLGFDLLITLYDVNTRSFAAVRLHKGLQELAWQKLSSFFSKLNNPNIEIRVIGLQSGEAGFKDVIEKLHKRIKGHLIEADLFGGELRHVCIDLKTGTSYNLLMLNRIYRPGELVNQATKPDANAEGSQQFTFVNV